MPQTCTTSLSLRMRRLDGAPDLRDEAKRALAAPNALVLFGPGRRFAFVGRDVVAAFDGARSAHRLRDVLREAAVQGEPSLAPVGAWGRAFFARRPADANWSGFGASTGFVFAHTTFVGDGVAFEQIADAPVLEQSPEPYSGHAPSLAAEDYRQTVADAVAAIGVGALEKVVCARNEPHELSRPLETGKLLDALLETGGESTVFVLRWAGATFFGSTPELLVSVRGADVQTMALAGSRDNRGSMPAATLAAELLADPKERAEHEYVVDGIRDALAPLTELASARPTPEVVGARHVVHLRTPIRARMRDGVDSLTLIDALHPTPALGGTPRERALDFIDRHEGDLRGWYGSPLGWLDASGNLEMCVTLRSALVRDRHAVLYAGAGVVAGSSPEGELFETEAKLAAMRDVLRQIDGE